jgi:hypothetical protein
VLAPISLETLTRIVVQYCRNGTPQTEKELPFIGPSVRRPKVANFRPTAEHPHAFLVVSAKPWKPDSSRYS